MASRADDLFRFLTGVMAQDPGQARRFMGTLDKAAEARLAAAAAAGDSRAILKELSAAPIWGGKPKAPQLNERRATREPISGREWSARPDSYVNRKARLMANSDALPADLAARVLAGDVDAMQDAVRRSVVTPRAGRPKKAEDAIRELAKPADQVAAENIAGQFERATNRPFADDAARQAELPFGPEDMRAPEVTVGGPAARAADEARLQEYMDGPAAGPQPSRLADDMTFDEVPARPRKPRVEPNDDAMRRAAYAAGAAGAAGGAYLLSRGGGEEPALTGSGNPAELQDEDPISGSAMAFSDEVGMGLPASDLTRPMGQPAPADHGVEYLKLMRRLNQMDRTGVPTTEERAMQAEVRRLGDLTTRQRREAGYSFPANHPTAKLRNEAMRFPIGSPERDRLNAQADAIENAVVTGRTPWDFGSTPEPTDPWAELNGPVSAPVRPEPPVVPRPAQRTVAQKPAARPPADLTEAGNPAELAPSPVIPARVRVDAAVEDAINPRPPAAAPSRPAPSPAQEPPMPARPAAPAPASSGLDLSHQSDARILDQAMRLQEHPEWYEGNPTAAAAIKREYDRRFGWLKPSTPEDAKLDAAATPITPDATVKDKPAPASPRDIYHARLVAAGYTPEQANSLIAFESTQRGGLRPQDVSDEALARKAAQSNATLNRWDAQAGPRVTRDELRRQADAEVRAKGSPANYADTGLHTDYRSPYGPMTNFAEGAMATVDGVQVPGYDLGDGRLRYRLGDVKAAQEAERDARWLAGHRAMVEGDIAKYGHYSIADDSGQLTEQQKKNREARVQAEKHQYAQVQRQREAQIANRNRQLTPYEEEQKARRDRVAARAMLAGGSQNINPQNAAAINALVELEGVDPNSMDAQQRNLMYAAPGGQGAAAVDAQSMQNAGNIISRYFNSGSIGGLMNPQAQAAALEERDRAVREQAYNFAVEERNKVHTFNEAPMTRDFALRLKRRVAARFGPRYADVVDGLPIEGDMAAAAPQSVPIDIPGGP